MRASREKFHIRQNDDIIFDNPTCRSRTLRLEWMKKKTSYRYTLNPIFSKTISLEY